VAPHPLQDAVFIRTPAWREKPSRKALRRTFEEVAEALGISRRTVSRKLDRFLKRAKELFGRGEP